MQGVESQELEQMPIDYYKESVRLYYFNIVLYQHLERVMQEKNEIKSRLQKFQAMEDQESEISIEDKRKRNRRSANEIPRSHVCSVSHCNKSYGSEGSLMQHMKIKHGLTGFGLVSFLAEQQLKLIQFIIMEPLYSCNSHSYSHYKFVVRSRSKQKTPLKQEVPPRLRSVTFASDMDLLKSISSQENLLDLIEREQKRKQELPISSMQVINQIKKKTQTQTQPKRNNIKMNTLPVKKEQYEYEQRETLDPYEQQSKINRIINNALKFKELRKDPVNASKSRYQSKVRMQIYLDKQFKNAFLTEPSDNVVPNVPNKKRVPTSSSRSVTKQIQLRDVHPSRHEYLNKTQHIYQLCYQYLST